MSFYCPRHSAASAAQLHFQSAIRIFRKNKMKKLVFMVLGMGLAALAPRALADDAAEKAELEKFKGTWVFDSVTDKGRKEPTPPGLEVVFDGATMRVKMGDETQKRTVKLNITTNPRQIDTTAEDGPMKGSVEPGIYEVTADQIKMCVAASEGTVQLDDKGNPVEATRTNKVGKRPTAFDDKQGAVIILKRKPN
jgi:uncharacterized protein (TIGR03067 family)